MQQEFHPVTGDVMIDWPEPLRIKPKISQRCVQRVDGELPDWHEQCHYVQRSVAICW